MSLDTIYLFFDAQLPNEELKTFLCAALNLDNIDSIQPQLNIPDETNSDKKLKSLFVKLSGIRSYTLSSGNLPQNRIPLSRVTVTKHTQDFKIGNGEAVITRLEKKTRELSGYTFIDETPELEYYFRSFDFTLSDVIAIFNRVIERTINDLTKFCSKSAIMEKVDQLRELIDKQNKLSSGAANFARMFAIGNGKVKDSKDEDKKYYIEEAKRHITFTADDITKAGNLIQEIKESPDYQTCYVIISDDYRVGDYFNGKTKFKTIEEIFDQAYSETY
jgi:hypothetical protein